MNDRIKLAEAMGWGMTVDTHPDQPLMTEPGKPNDGMMACPDPFTDANDDYAVLEWLRAEDNKPYQFHMSQLYDGKKRYEYDYQIGDYARAALKVL